MEQRRYVSLAFWARDKREQASALSDLALAPALEPWALHEPAGTEPVAQLETASEPEAAWPQVA